jgi:hypothetical protein
MIVIYHRGTPLPEVLDGYTFQYIKLCILHMLFLLAEWHVLNYPGDFEEYNRYVPLVICM